MTTIRTAELRAHVIEHRDFGDGYSDYELPHDLVLALLDVAEAAKRCMQEGTDEDGKRWFALNPAGQRELYDALTRLDFSE